MPQILGETAGSAAKLRYLKGSDPIEGTPFSLNHDYGRKGSVE